MYQLNDYTSLGSSKGADKAVHYYWEKIDTNNLKVILYGTATDARGGVAGDRLVDELRTLDRIKNGMHFSMA